MGRKRKVFYKGLSVAAKSRYLLGMCVCVCVCLIEQIILRKVTRFGWLCLCVCMFNVRARFIIMINNN